jgi:hypothetical protein
MPKTKRNYRREYLLYNSSPEKRKYRSELNKYNRAKGVYGNGDGKDASHHHGKITGFEDEHTNKGRAGEGGRRKGVKHVFHKRRRSKKS